ncbi:Uncharacterized protein FKW44_004471, partial [Caligus rogercresseyi]
HLSKWKDVSNVCNVCMEEPQTADHLIHRCPALSYERLEAEHSEEVDDRILVLMKCRR